MASTTPSQSSSLAIDPLSDVLSLLRPQGYMSGGFDAGGDWSLHFGAHDGIKFQYVVSGSFWLQMDGDDTPVRIDTGDCFLLPRGRPFTISSDPALVPVDAQAFLQTPLNGGTRTVNGGGACRSVGCRFDFHGRHAEMLLGLLPPVVHIHEEADKLVMRAFVERLMAELRAPQPGGFVVAQQLATLLLVQALRLQLDAGPRGRVGWLYALADRSMSQALGAMHANPAQRWTIQTLAERAGMSRSSFAKRFRDTVGTSPMDYLARWRMRLAADRLARGDASVSALSFALGYESESAFSTAFKRLMGCSPRAYGRRHEGVDNGVDDGSSLSPMGALASHDFIGAGHG